MELGDPIFHLKRPRVKPINIVWLQISNYHTNITRLCNRFTILLAVFQYFQDFDILLLFAYYTWSSLREYAPCSKKFICWFSACLKPITEKKHVRQITALSWVSIIQCCWVELLTNHWTCTTVLANIKFV